MIHSVALTLLGKIFGSIFQTSKVATDDAKEDLFSAVKALVRIGGPKLREFLASVPIFVLFVRELVVRRKELGSEAELMVLGAGSALGVLLTSVVVTLMSGLAFQSLLLVTWPVVGIPLFFATSISIFSVVVFLVWIIVFVLNSTFSANPVFMEIRNRFLPESARALLDTLEEEVKQSEADLDALSALVSESLNRRGVDTDGKKLVDRLEQVVESKLFKRFQRVDDCNIPNISQEGSGSMDEKRQKMRAESEARREKAMSKAGRR
jgi:hypothetical protein